MYMLVGLYALYHMVVYAYILLSTFQDLAPSAHFKTTFKINLFICLFYLG